MEASDEFFCEQGDEPSCSIKRYTTVLSAWASINTSVTFRIRIPSCPNYK